VNTVLDDAKREAVTLVEQFLADEIPDPDEE
jgi:hypothetical protein